MAGFSEAFIICLVFNCLIIYVFYNSVINIEQHLFKKPELSSSKEEIRGFVYPEEQERFDWKAILEPCKSDLNWKPSKSRHNAAQKRTSAKDCILSDYEINPSGYYSKFVLQTRTVDGTDKNIGGDYWRARLTGPASQSGFVRDLMNGKYEIWFLIAEPGNYELNLLLEHSLCDGLRDPPLGWFERGNIHGRFQQEGILGYIDDFLVEKISPIPFTVESNTSMESNYTKERHIYPKHVGKNQVNCNISQSAPCFAAETFKRNCSLVWDGYGRWEKQNQRFKWVPNFPISKPADFSDKERLETLWFIGDSVTYRLWDSSYTRVLCKQAFKRCKKTYMWVYELGEFGEKHEPINVGLKFNYTRFFASLHSILTNSDMKSNRSVILINYGLHLIMSMNFSEYRDLLDTFVAILDQYRQLKNQSSIPQFLWKTTTLSHKENTKRWNVTQARFLTNHRISLFNAYTNARLCTAGITILDVFPISASFPEGTRDHVHYHNFVFEPAEDALADYVWRKFQT